MNKKYHFLLLFCLQNFIANDLFANGLLPNNTCLDMHVIHTLPLGYINNQQKLVGVQVDFLKAIEAESGVCINKHLMSYDRIWKSLKQQKHDGGIFFKNPNNMNIVKPIAYVGDVNTVIIPQAGYTIDKYEQLKSLTIGRAQSSNLHSKFEHDKELSVVEVNDYDQVTKMLAAGRLNAIAGSEPILRYQLAKYRLNDKVNLDGIFVLGSREQWLQMSLKPHNSNTINKLKQAVERLYEQQVFSQIMMQYFDSSMKK